MLQFNFNYTYGSSDWGDILTRYNGAIYKYDAIGNLVKQGALTYTWEHGRQLASISYGSDSCNFSYNSDGMRTQRTDGDTTYNYIYNGSSLSQMTVGSNTLSFAYDADGRPMTVTYNGTTYYYATNLQGDVTGIFNEDGTYVVNYTYDAWGIAMSITGSMASTLGRQNPLRYRGYVYDEETGYYYLQSRYYNPEFCRFINADGQLNADAILGYNMFAYTYNNPIMLKDSNGARPILSMTIGSETGEEKDASIAYMKALPYYNKIAQTQSDLNKMGFVDTSHKTAKECTDTLTRNGIDSAEEKAHFFSQCAKESNLGMWLLELGNAEYLQSKSYYPYYGAGYIQLTWDFNYREFANAMCDPQILIQGPKYVAEKYAWSAAGWFWEVNGINEEIANGASVVRVTEIVNGARGGLSDRQRYYNAFLPIFLG